MSRPTISGARREYDRGNLEAARIYLGRAAEVGLKSAYVQVSRRTVERLAESPDTELAMTARELAALFPALFESAGEGLGGGASAEVSGMPIACAETPLKPPAAPTLGKSGHPHLPTS